MAFHALHADSNDPGNIVARAIDTDILVILICNANKFTNNIWLDSGLDYNNSRKFVDITHVSQSLEHLRSLPGIYAFTGMDYMPSFHGKGKIRQITIMKSQERFVKAFENLGDTDIDATTVSVTEEFVFHVYGYKKKTNIHRFLALHFEAKCKPKKSGKPLDSIKNTPKKFSSMPKSSHSTNQKSTVHCKSVQDSHKCLSSW